MGTTEIQRIIRYYYKQQYTNKMNHLVEMDIRLEGWNLQKLNLKKLKIETDQSQLLKLKLWLRIFQQTEVQNQNLSNI